MSKLEKAKIQEVTADTNEKAIGAPMLVQFNPSSLKLKLTNTTAGDKSRTSQSRQHVGEGATVLTTELIFDTADEGSEESPVSVRSKTRELEKYVLPEKGTEKPPRLRFEWDELMVSGTVESLDIEFDLFAANGAPLRAKVSLSIKSQEPKYMLGKAGVAARDSVNAKGQKEDSNRSKPGSSVNDPKGMNVPGAGNRSDRALEGESPAEFAARHGLDPEAWRGLDVNMFDGFTLPAGIEVGFNTGLAFKAGIGVKVGASADLGLSLEAALGLDASASASLSAGVSSGTAVGFALSAAGGVDAALETLKISRSSAAEQKSRQAFAVEHQGGASEQLGAARQQRQQPRTPLKSKAGQRHSAQQEVAAAPAPPKVDARASSYGHGVPLRQRYNVDVTLPDVTVYSHSCCGAVNKRGDK